ncbi:MAG: glycosyltransferase family 4 protein [Verrucomicrobiales bacterium]
MKILTVTNLYPPHYLGGYELICHAVVNALRSRGHEVNVLTSNHVAAGKANQPDETGVERSLRINGFYGHPWVGIKNLRHMERHNNETLRQAISKHRPDLVYVWNLGGISKSLVFTLERLNIPTVYYLSDHWIARGMTADVWLNWWNRKEASTPMKAARKAAELTGIRAYWDRIAPTSPPAQATFKRLYFCSKALRKLTASAGAEVMHGAVIYCPVNVEKFTGTPKAESHPMEILFWVGRLAADKGILTALKAMQLAKDKFSGRLNVYGNGDADYVAQMKDFVVQHQLPVSFKSAGMNEMPRVYQDHDALLFTSEWAEPFALTPLEAMASGLPVIGTTTGGSREIFRHADNALTYTAGSAEELANRILELAGNGALRARIASTARAEVRDTYAEPIIVDQIEQYLRETVTNWN